MSIVTLEQAKQQLNIDLAYTGDDKELQGYVDAVTAVVEDYTGIVIEQRQVTQRIELRGASTFLLANVPVVSLDSLTSVDGTQAWDVADLDVDPDSGRVTVLRGSRPKGLFVAVSTVGYATDEVPARFVRGALVILQHTWETQRGQGSVGAGVVGAEESWDPASSFSIPRRALEWLGEPLPGIA